MTKTFVQISVLLAVLAMTACKDSTPSNTQDFERQKHIANAMSEMEKFQQDLIDQSKIIVFGQIQSAEQGVYLDTIEYLKVPTELQNNKHLSLGDGIEPGRNIPSLNNMALVFLAEDMTLLEIYKSSQGSPNYETWRQLIIASRRNTP